MSEKVTLQDIAARHVGVSKALVSMYLNNKSAGRVSQDTKQKIDRAVKELNYKPSLTAQALSSGKTRTIGMICGGLKNPYFAYLVEDAMEEAARHGYQLLLALTRWIPQEEQKVLENILQRQIDGLISCIDTLNKSSVNQILLKSGIPVFCINEPKTHFMNVNADLVPAMDKCMQQFVQNGYHTVYGSFYENSTWPAAFREAGKKYNLKLKMMPKVKNEEEVQNFISSRTDQQSQAFIINEYQSLLWLQRIFKRMPEARPSIVMGLDDYCILQNFDYVSGSIYTDTPEIIRITVKRLIESIENPDKDHGSEAVSRSLFLDRESSEKRQQELAANQSVMKFPIQPDRI